MTDYDELWSDVYGDIQEYGPVHRHLQRLVAADLRELDYQSVLDVGCGEGNNYPLLAAGRTLTSYVGVDISRVALDKAAQAVPDANFRLLDVQSTIPQGQWDMVYCSLLMEHLEDDETAISNLRPVVGRYLLVTTMAGDYDRYQAWERRVGHVRNYAPGELESKLRKHGFNVLTARYWGYPFYSPLARRAQNHTSVGAGHYGGLARLVASLTYYLFFLNSRRRGDLLVVLATPEETGSA